MREETWLAVRDEVWRCICAAELTDKQGAVLIELVRSRVRNRGLSEAEIAFISNATRGGFGAAKAVQMEQALESFRAFPEEDPDRAAWKRLRLMGTCGPGKQWQDEVGAALSAIAYEPIPEDRAEARRWLREKMETVGNAFWAHIEKKLEDPDGA